METDSKPLSGFKTNDINSKLFSICKSEATKITNDFVMRNPNVIGIKFCVLQSIMNTKNTQSLLLSIAKFYNENYVGNKDFIHIPNLENILKNTMFPILIAINEESGEILGATTIKFENNENFSDNPYFPTQNEYILSITNILTKLNLIDNNGKRICGIGKELFKFAIRSAYELNKNIKVRLICEVDCRNTKSISSVKHSVLELLEDNLHLNACIRGYYEIQNNINGNLIEAPTFVVEILLNSIPLNNTKINISYLNCRKSNLYKDIKTSIKKETFENSVYTKIGLYDSITYHSISPLNLLSLNLDVGDSADGNVRKPIDIYSNLKIKVKEHI